MIDYDIEDVCSGLVRYKSPTPKTLAGVAHCITCSCSPRAMRIYDAYIAGQSQTKLAAKYGISKSRASQDVWSVKRCKMSAISRVKEKRMDRDGLEYFAAVLNRIEHAAKLAK